MTTTEMRPAEAPPAQETSFLPTTLPSEPTGSFLDTMPLSAPADLEAVPSAQVGRHGRVPVVRGDRQPFLVRLGRALCGHHMD